MSTARANSAPTSEAQWILDGPRDLALMVLPPLWIVPLVYILGAVVTDRAINDWVAALGAIGHHVPGMLRAYGDRALLRRFRARFIVAPLFLGAVCLSASYSGVQALIFIAFAWGVWHGLAQSYGFARIYGAKAGVTDRPSALADRWLLIAWFITAVIWSPLRLYYLLDMAAICGMPLPSAGALSASKIALASATALVTLAWLIVAARRLRAGRGIGGVRVLLLVTSIAFWWFANVRIHNLLLGLPLFELFHDAQYLTIVWAFNRRRSAGARDQVGKLLVALSRPSALSIALYLGSVCAYGALSFYPPTATLGWTVTGLVAASQLLHFYYDGFIWKVREPQTGKVLGVATTSAKPVSTGSPTTRHLVWWLAFVIPAAALWLGENASNLSLDERRVAVAELVPDNYIGQFTAAETLWKRGDHESALAGFRHALAIDPSQSRVRRNLALSLGEMADRADSSGDAAGTRKYMDELVRMRPLLDGEVAQFADERITRYGAPH